MNQYDSRKVALLDLLYAARTLLRYGYVQMARMYLRSYRYSYKITPASTQRRWKCGK